MALLKKKVEKEIEKEVKTETVAPASGKCECGEPVAIELGQNQVCAKHMRNR